MINSRAPKLIIASRKGKTYCGKFIIIIALRKKIWYNEYINIGAELKIWNTLF